MIVIAQYNLFGANMCYDYVYLDNLSNISAYRNHNVLLCPVPNQLLSRGVSPCIATHLQALLLLTAPISKIFWETTVCRIQCLQSFFPPSHTGFHQLSHMNHHLCLSNEQAYNYKSEVIITTANLLEAILQHCMMMTNILGMSVPIL